MTHAKLGLTSCIDILIKIVKVVTPEVVLESVAVRARSCHILSTAT